MSVFSIQQKSSQDTGKINIVNLVVTHFNSMLCIRKPGITNIADDTQENPNAICNTQRVLHPLSILYLDKKLKQIGQIVFSNFWLSDIFLVVFFIGWGF